MAYQSRETKKYTKMTSGPNKREKILAAQVRNISLNLISRYLKDESEENDKFRKDLILKLATNILPRKNEVTGEDGGPLKLTGVDISIRK